MKTISSGRARLSIAEHKDSVFVCVDVDGAGYSLFLTPAMCMEAAGELIEIARRLKRR